MSRSDSQARDSEIWDALLDDFETELREAGALLREGGRERAQVWAPPVALPPLPARLVVRVRDLLKRQAEALERLEASRLIARRQLRFLQADPAKALAGGPRFVDKGA